MDLKEKKINSQLIYKGKIVDLYKDDVELSNGVKAFREVIRHQEAVCILAKVDDKFIVEEQYRYPFDDIIIEFPAGKIDKGEDKEKAAIRELEEETGYLANSIKYLGSMYPSCAYTDEIIHLYYTDDLTKTKQHFDEDEMLNVKFMTMEEIEELVKSHKLKDAKSQCALYLYSLNK